MKRFTTLAASAVIVPALGLAAAPAASAAPKPAPAPKNPVEALAKALAKGTTLTRNANATMDFGDGVKLTVSESGVLKLNSKGVFAADTTSKAAASRADKGTEVLPLLGASRTILLNGTAYLQSPIFKDRLPAGKTWLKVTGKDLHGTQISGGSAFGLVDVFEPGVAKYLVTKSAVKPGGAVDGVKKTTLYSGSATVAELAKVSKTLRDALGRDAKGKEAKQTIVKWGLWADANQLPVRLTTSMGLKGDKAPLIKGIEQFKKWGAPVSIVAPPAELVATLDELRDGKDEESQESFGNPRFLPKLFIDKK
ncbi:hypothetical protein [Bailinhaonella thermotolerans]|uniref:LppX_LprAFG lipoprotein n=1 Tax=Bailinhaonella thermotolerans TaxID=1070861 RepID=A0A3A4A6Y5_9ACTN|nr:hypothetical protein [Bailinhaonella thermotolerans]RJL23639.1 hypothetical protein D5H75_32605 [Bailinhaonella thermotolerans]